jgi:hypothetical protein
MAATVADQYPSHADDAIATVFADDGPVVVNDVLEGAELALQFAPLVEHERGRPAAARAGDTFPRSDVGALPAPLSSTASPVRRQVTVGRDASRAGDADALQLAAQAQAAQHDIGRSGAADSRRCGG